MLTLAEELELIELTLDDLLTLEELLTLLAELTVVVGPEADCASWSGKQV